MGFLLIGQKKCLGVVDNQKIGLRNPQQPFSSVVPFLPVDYAPWSILTQWLNSPNQKGTYVFCSNYDKICLFICQLLSYRQSLPTVKGWIPNETKRKLGYPRVSVSWDFLGTHNPSWDTPKFTTKTCSVENLIWWSVIIGSQGFSLSLGNEVVVNTRKKEHFHKNFPQLLS